MFACRFFDGLQFLLDKIPFEERLNCSFSFTEIESEVLNCVEGSYRQATKRLAQLFYYLEWARTLASNKRARPDLLGHSPDRIGHSFYDIESMKPKEVRSLNTTFSDWVMNQTMRELSEFLLFYLMNLYDICAVTQHARKPIKPEHVVDRRIKSKEFEDSGMKERLKAFRDSFGFTELTHHQQILSLYEARNVFSHFDGVVQDKFCNDDGEMQIIWPVNTVKFRQPGQKRLVPYHRVRKPFEGGCEVVITWLNKLNICTYKEGDKIQLTYKELNDLIFFYLYIFNELQAGLINHVENQGLKVKPFEEYILQPKARGIVVDGEPVELELTPSDKSATNL